ncbi:hypothetical protein [Galbibacter marinus]
MRYRGIITRLETLSDGAKPQFATVMKVLKAIGGQIQVSPKSA